MLEFPRLDLGSVLGMPSYSERPHRLPFRPEHFDGFFCCLPRTDHFVSSTSQSLQIDRLLLP